MSVKTIKIHDTGKGLKSVKDDLEAVLKKIEGWHQGSIADFSSVIGIQTGSGPDFLGR
jgi:hypothetical protein